MYCLKKFLFFDIPLLYYYTNYNSSITCCTNYNSLISGNIYLSFGISISSSFCWCNSFGGFFETLVILSAILSPTKSSVASAVFLITLFEAVFYCICCTFFSSINNFLTILIAHVFSKRQKSIALCIYL